MTPSDLHRWVIHAASGQVLAYHRGALVLDRRKDPELDVLAKAVWRVYESGFVRLYQSRRGPLDYDYLAVRTSR